MNNNNFKGNWGFQEQYLDQVKKIIKDNAMHIIDIEISTPQEDMEKAVDMKVTANRGHVAVRIRRAHQKFRDITIRSANKGHITEIHKIIEGYADYYLYCWENKNCTAIGDWVLIDINKCRDVFFDGFMEKEETYNKDGVTAFIAFGIHEFVDKNAVIDYHFEDDVFMILYESIEDCETIEFTRK